MKQLVHTLALVVFATVFASAAPGAAPPPWFPDDVHVANGCHLSALAYVARFTAAFPHEQAPVIVVVPHRANSRKSHTFVLVSWRGRWWGRDEYKGVFPLHLSTRTTIPPDQLEARARSAYREHAAVWIRRHLASPDDAPRGLDYRQRLAAVQAAARLVPFPAEVYSACGDGSDAPLLFFAPKPGWIAVYDPQHGTAVAECAATDTARIVGTVARRLGYRVDNVRPHPTKASESGVLVAGTAGGP